MRIVNVKRAIIILLMMVVIAGVSGCVRYPGEPGPEPGETDYQLQITVQVSGELNVSDGIYYIVLDANENPADGPEDNVEDWEDDFYYIELKSDFFSFAQVEEGSPELQLTDSSYSGDKLEITIALSDLGDPSSVDINVVTTDSDYNTYDYLDDGYFTINAKILGSIFSEDISGDSEDGGVDFDIIKVTAKITIP